MEFNEEYFTTKEEGMANYRNFSHFRERALWVQNNLSGSILEIGCAFGFFIDELKKISIVAYGIDGSAYALSQVPLNIVTQVSLLDISKIDKSYDWIISWNVLDCLQDDADAVKCATALNSFADSQLHIICMSGQQYTDQGYFIRDYNYWRNLFPSAYLVDHETKTMYVPDGKSSLSGVPLVKNLVSD